MEKIPLIVIAGPTASGKSGLGVQIARKIGGEIISADSMQVYRGMDIGTAKITEAETLGVPHHLIDVVDPAEEWNVREFCLRAKPIIEDIHRRGSVPMVVGGTGFYIRALAYGAEFDEEEEKGIRSELEALSTEELHARLTELDPKSAEAIHPNNRKRVIRALEFFMQNGGPISEHNETMRAKESPYNLCYLVLAPERSKLYERIEARVDEMRAQGLVDEVRGLLEKGYDRSLVSMQGLGYKEVAAYLAGECTEDEAIANVKLGTRHFAKRQLTWFRREQDAVFVEVSDDKEKLFGDALAVIAEKTGLPV